MLEKFDDLLGETITAIEFNGDDRDMLIFTLNNGERYKLWHEQECCEGVGIEDICGDLNDLIGHGPLLLAEEVIHRDINPEDVPIPEYHDESFTWTFYKLATVWGAVTIRWFGASNGYYSEEVDFDPC